jgi:hypothetical protein
MLTVPLRALPYQTATVTLGGQACQFNVRSSLGVLFMDVYVDNAPVILGVQCQNRVIRSKHLGFAGDLIFVDTQSPGTDPVWEGLGSRYLLEYLTTDDLAALGFAA